MFAALSQTSFGSGVGALWVERQLARNIESFSISFCMSPFYDCKVSSAAGNSRSTGVYEAAPLLAARVDDPLSRHFRAGEFFPHDPSYRYLRVSPELVRRLEEIRQALGGQPLTIHSAYRPPAYNQAVGGVSNSTHIDGLAADISVVGVSTERLHQVADQVIGDGGGVGYYPAQQFVHIDVRGHRARWTG